MATISPTTSPVAPVVNAAQDKPVSALDANFAAAVKADTKPAKIDAKPATTEAPTTAATSATTASATTVAPAALSPEAVKV